MQDSPVRRLDAALFQELIARARQSARLRVNYNFHSGMEDNPHRFLNVMIQGTYVAPHRHRDPPKSESFVILEGEAAFFTFDDAGRIEEIHRLGRDAVGVDVKPGLWHTLAVLSPHVVCYEVKPGPYLQANDKEFAPWAPREGDPDAARYLEELVRAVTPANP